MLQLLKLLKRSWSLNFVKSSTNVEIIRDEISADSISYPLAIMFEVGICSPSHILEAQKQANVIFNLKTKLGMPYIFMKKYFISRAPKN